MKDQKEMDFPGALPGVQEVALQKALRMLDALPVQYIIVPADGRMLTRGELTLAPTPKPRTKRARTESDYPYGALQQHVGPYIDAAQVGDVARIPFAPFDKNSVRGSATAYASKRWGKGSYTSAMEGEFYEILRIA